MASAKFQVQERSKRVSTRQDRQLRRTKHRGSAVSGRKRGGCRAHHNQYVPGVRWVAAGFPAPAGSECSDPIDNQGE